MSAVIDKTLYKITVQLQLSSPICAYWMALSYYFCNIITSRMPTGT